jgi:RNA polymerase sigma-70 factor (ECF subfamily)
LLQIPYEEERDTKFEDFPNNPEKILGVKERSTRIHTVLFQLPSHYRLVLEMRHFQDMSYEEISNALDRPLNTIKSHLFRARKQMANLLNKYLTE